MILITKHQSAAEAQQQRDSHHLHLHLHSQTKKPHKLQERAHSIAMFHHDSTRSHTVVHCSPARDTSLNPFIWTRCNVIKHRQSRGLWVSSDVINKHNTNISINIYINHPCAFIKCLIIKINIQLKLFTFTNRNYAHT